MVRAGRIVTYKISVRPAAKKPADEPILNVRIALPAGVAYVDSKASPGLYTRDPSGKKVKRQPVQSDGGMVLTWEDFGSARKGRKFLVKVRVDSGIASGTPLTFTAELFEFVAVGGSVTCSLSAPDVTLTVV